MRRPYVCAVIGKNFGDEGKGLAVDYLTMQAQTERVLVIRHNGGAQSGHTVDLPKKRFVFHELSSGSFRGADTLWADTYYPDLYKLEEEILAFQNAGGEIPVIYAQPDTCITLIDDILLNMAAEEARGENRHGSCGMGIYEAQLRSEAGFAVKMCELWNMDQEELVNRLSKIRDVYLPRRMQELGLAKESLGEYGVLLENATVLENTATEILKNLKYITPVKDMLLLLDSYERIIFENGQGLLLDEEKERFLPHVTASRTGLYNPCRFLAQYGLKPDLVLYVTRSYVTRHGAGELPYECGSESIGIVEPDRTNVDNPWQGSLRYARHGGYEEFVEDVREDLQIPEQHHMQLPCRALMITHLNETGNALLMSDGNYSVQQFCMHPLIQETFDKVYLSASFYAEEIVDVR